MSRNARRLKCDSEAPSGAPDNPATFPGTAEQQFKSIGKFGLPPDLKAGPARRIIYNSAINNRGFGANDHFGRIGNSACRPHTCEPSRIHRRSSTTEPQWILSQTILNASLSFIVIKNNILTVARAASALRRCTPSQASRRPVCGSEEYVRYRTQNVYEKLSI